MKNMQTVEKLHKLIEQYNQEILNTKKWIWGVSIEKLLLPYQSLVKEFEVALSKGRMSMLKGSKIYNTFPLDNKILSRKEFDSAYQKAVNVSAQLIQIKRTIQRLSIYAHKYPWPLQDTEKNRLGNVVQKFVSPYIPVIDSIDITKENLISWGNDLEICQQTIIKDVMSLLPNSAEAENRALKEIEHRRKYIAEEIERIEERKSPLTAQIKALSHELYSDQQPSFIKIVSERTKEEKIDAYFKQAMDTAKTYMGSWLKPEIFLDVLRSSHP